GDWVESCTALVEHPDGQMEIIPWAEVFNQHVLIAKAA
ncbi:MAG TPA: UDP-2,3-diacylglucosamine hydrolase, partial [Methylophaga sp.]|nr:UDP-2,3-diacylglucosamine hydrolase [Methylophaga sp.]HCO01138.1 UDP-2,3-diacylglucosamine hydrolase [Methylophaga sp.]